MALTTIVKVSNISNLSDARYCAGMGVQYLGFSLDPGHKAYIDPPTFKSIREWIAGPSIVGEMLECEPERIVRTLDQYDIDCIEISDPESIIEFTRRQLPIILKLDISAYQKLADLSSILAECQDKVIFFLLERSGSARIQIGDIFRLADEYRIMIAFDIDSNSLQHWIDNTKILGISLKGGTEEIPGFKDYDELADILEMIEAD